VRRKIAGSTCHITLLPVRCRPLASLFAVSSSSPSPSPSPTHHRRPPPARRSCASTSAACSAPPPVRARSPSRHRRLRTRRLSRIASPSAATRRRLRPRRRHRLPRRATASPCPHLCFLLRTPCSSTVPPPTRHWTAFTPRSLSLALVRSAAFFVPIGDRNGS
jgi:hypothetical protein